MPKFCASQRAPAPPHLSDDYLRFICARDVHTMSMTMDLNSASSMQKFAIFLVPRGAKVKKPPYHILGGYSSWKEVLHGIRFFNELAPRDCLLESAKGKGMAKEERQRLHCNMVGLASN